MNRAMGFGILSGTMTGTMLASAAVAPTPVSAHGPVQASSFGSIAIDFRAGLHLSIIGVDNVCGDGVVVAAQIKTNNAETFTMSTTDCNGIFSEIHGDWVSFRKCLRMGGGPSACNDADWETI